MQAVKKEEDAPQFARSEATRNAWIKLLLGMAFVVIGCNVVYLAIEMVGIFGEGMGIDEASRKIYSRAHIAVHIFGTASSVAVGLFVLGRNRGLAALAMAAIILCGGYGIVNMIGFTTTNRLSVSEARSASSAADWKKYENARSDLEKQIKWLEGQVVDASPREQRRMYAEINAKRKEMSAVEPPRPSAATVLADPQATWFSKLTGWASENWQLALPVPVAFLLFAAEVLSFVFAVHLIVSAVETLWLGPRHSNRSGGDDGGGGSGKPKGGIEPQPFTKPRATVAAVPSVAARTATVAPPVAPNVVPMKVAVSGPADALRDLQELLARKGYAPSQQALASRWQLSKGRVSHLVSGWENAGKVQRIRKGRFNEIVARPMGVGGSRYASAAG